MLNKKTMKVISIVAMVMMLVMMLSSVVFAGEDPSTWLPSGPSSSGNVIPVIKNAGASIWGIFTAIGGVVAVVILVWLGIKYIMASPDGKADIKKQAFGYILGAALVFGASSIVGAVIKFTTEMTGAAGGV